MPHRPRPRAVLHLARGDTGSLPTGFLLLAVDPDSHLLDEPELLEALAEAQDTRTGDDDHRYQADVRTLEAQRKVATSALAPTRTA